MSGAPLLWLEEAGPAAEASVGPKLAKLGELARIGLTVPQGFALTTNAYRLFLEESGVGPKLGRLLGGVGDPNDLAALEQASHTARRLIETAPMPGELAGLVHDAYEELSDRCHDLNVPMAVRSSASGEDGSHASFAGQYDTYLGVTGTARLIDAIHRCWSSLFATRALAYRFQNGLGPVDCPMAVGVLELVHARCSGVAFSIHPVTGKRDRMVIEGSWGWGEAVVQGLVTPDHIEVGKADRRILRYDVATKEIVSAFDYEAGRVVETEMPRRLRERPILDEEQVGAVVEVLLTVEEHFGRPVDVEWVLSRHRRPGEPVTVVQARPETVHSSGGGARAAAEDWNEGAFALRYAFGISRKDAP